MTRSKVSACIVWIVTVVLFLDYQVAAQARQPRQPRQQAMVVREPSAIAVLTKTVAALGGDAILSKVQDSTAFGVWHFDSRPEHSFKWKEAGTEFRYETEDGEETRVTASRHGMAGTASSSGTIKKYYGQMNLSHFPVHLAPLLLYQRLVDPKFSVRLRDAVMLPSGDKLLVLETADQTDEMTRRWIQTWYLSEASFMPIRVRYILPDAVNAAITTAFRSDLTDWRAESGILLPHRLERFVEDHRLEIDQIDHFSFNQGSQATEFDLSERGQQ